MRGAGIGLAVSGVVAVLVAACESTPPARGPTPPSPDPPASVGGPVPSASSSHAKGAPKPRFPCGPARAVASGADVLAAMREPWTTTSWLGNEIPPVSVELVATRDFALKSEDLPVPPFCAAKCTQNGRNTTCDAMPPRLTNDTTEDPKGPCLHPLRFEAPRPLDGVSLRDEARVLEVRTGARFRVQRSVRPPWVGIPFFTPVHAIVAACGRCNPGEKRCAEDGLCYEEGLQYCLRCMTLGRERCACRDESYKTRPDNAPCEYAISDYGASGSCKEGKCVTPQR